MKSRIASASSFILLLVLVTAPGGYILPRSALAQVPPTFDLAWGQPGTGDGQFNGPGHIAVGLNGNVYVVDRQNSRVQEFTDAGGFITKWGSSGQFNFPVGITIDPTGNVYVADYFNDRIQKFSDSGAFITVIGSHGSTGGLFIGPAGLASDAGGGIYVVDRGNNRIEKFAADGTFVQEWGSAGGGNYQFSSPWAVATDALGDVYVVDRGNNRILKYSASGNYIRQWGAAGIGDGQFSSPQAIATNSIGHVFVADTNNHRVQEFDSTGVFITKWGTYGGAPGEFMYTTGVACSGPAIYVSDSTNGRVQKFIGAGAGTTFTITASAGPGGQIAPDGPTVVLAGASQTYTITPDSGYVIADVRVDNIGNGRISSYPFENIIADHTISATFEPGVRITATAGPGGTIRPAGVTPVPWGGSQAYVITPDSNYAIDDVRVNGVSVGRPSVYPFSSVTSDQTIDATFAGMYTITATAAPGGNINPPGTTSTPRGSTVTYVMTAPAGRTIRTVLVDGVSRGRIDASVYSYTFENVQANHTIVLAEYGDPGERTIHFQTYGVDAVAECGGPGVNRLQPTAYYWAPSGDIRVGPNTSIRFTMNTQIGCGLECAGSGCTCQPGQCEIVANVTVDGQYIGVCTEYELQTGSSDHVILVDFVLRYPGSTCLPPPPVRILTLDETRSGSCGATTWAVASGNAFSDLRRELVSGAWPVGVIGGVDSGGCCPNEPDASARAMGGDGMRFMTFSEPVREITAGALAQCEVVLLGPPGGPTSMLNECEVTLLRSFVEQGGTLIAFWDYAGRCLGPAFGATPGPIVYSQPYCSETWLPTPSSYGTFADLGPYGVPDPNCNPAFAVFHVGTGMAVICCDEERFLSGPLGDPLPGGCGIIAGRQGVYFMLEAKCNAPELSLAPSSGTFPVKVYADSFGVGGESHWTTIPANTLLDVGRWNSNSPNNAITHKGTLATDADGMIHLGDLPGAFAAGDSFVLTYHGHQEPTHRGYHEAVDGLIYEQTVDNLYIRPEDGRVIPGVLGTCPMSVVKTFLTHTMMHFNLVVSIEWPSAYDWGGQYIDDLKQMFRKASDYLFDVSNGQATFEKIAIYDNMSHWLQADLRILANNDEEAWPESSPNGAYAPAGADVWIKFPPVFRGSTLENRVASLESNPSLEENHPRTLVHEFGHYAFGLYDEYQDAGRNRLPPHPNYGFMDSQYAGSDFYSGMDSEMSWAWPPWVIPSEYARTAQAARNADLTCAEQMKHTFERDSDPVPAKLRYTPAEYLRGMGSPHWFRGPNDNGVVDANGISMGARVQFVGGETTVAVHQARPLLVELYGHPAGGARVWLKKPARAIDLGRTPMTSPPGMNYRGKIKLLGADPGDVVLASYSDDISVAQAVYTLPPLLGASSPARVAGLSSGEDTLALSPIQGDYAMLAAVDFNGGEPLRYTLAVSQEFGGPAEIGNVDGGAGGTIALTPGTTGYSADIGPSVNQRSQLLLSAADSLGGGLFAFHALEIDSITAMSGELHLDRLPVWFQADSSAATVTRIAFLGTDYPPPMAGLSPTARRLSPVVHLAADPDNAVVAGRLGIVYQTDSLADDPAAPQPRIYRWQNGWIALETQDDGRQGASATIENPGFYAVFAESVAVTGVPGSRLPDERPGTFVLEAGLPNPMSSSTSISFVLFRPEQVTLRVYDMAGRRVRSLLVSEARAAGRQMVTWDGKDDAGGSVASGIYIVRLEVGRESANRKITLVR